MPASARIRRPSSSFVPVRRITSGILRDVVSRYRVDDAARDLVAARDTAEDIDEENRRARVVHDQLVAVAHAFGVRAAADVEKVGDLRRRRCVTASIVAIARPAPLAIVPTRPGSAGSCGCRRRRAPPAARLRRAAAPAPLGELGVAKERIVVELDLRVRRDDAPVRSQRERIDLDQLRAVTEEHVVHRARDGGKLLAVTGIELRRKCQLASDERRVSDRDVRRRISRSTRDDARRPLRSPCRRTGSR